MVKTKFQKSNEKTYSLAAWKNTPLLMNCQPERQQRIYSPSYISLYFRER